MDAPYQTPYRTAAPQLDWTAGNEPRSTAFDDVYYHREQGLAEARQVFLQGNRLAERFAALARGASFHIGETGFGTGLNFLACWQLWHRTAPADCRLVYVSVERYPLNRDQLARALRPWQPLGELADTLLAHYPPLVPGWHRLQLDAGQVTLQLLFDDAAQGLQQLVEGDVAALSAAHSAKFDAWFLDGFAPSRNPAMWTDDLYATLARLSRPGTSLASFTVAGHVRRGLQAQGFAVQRAPGFGDKRASLQAHFEGQPPPGADPESARYGWAAAPRPAHDRREVAVVGGGLAGTACAQAMARRGWRVSLLEQHEALAREASGNRQGVLFTRLSPKSGELPRFALASYLYALDHYRQLPLGVGEAAACGVLQLAHNETERALLAALAPLLAGHQDWAEVVDADRASALAGVPVDAPALWFPRAGWLAPPAVCRAQADPPSINLALGEAVDSLRREGRDWLLLAADGRLLCRTPVVVLANAGAAARLLPDLALPLQAIRGQISIARCTTASAGIKAVLCHEGYLTPASDGLHSLGATFDRRDRDPAVREDDHQRNLSSLFAALPALRETGWNPASCQGQVGFRCATPDYLPVVGPAPDMPLLARRFASLARNARQPINAIAPCLEGLYLSVGHGSRGLTSTPLAAELLAAQICGEPRPLPFDLVRALSPARFAIRALKRRG